MTDTGAITDTGGDRGGREGRAARLPRAFGS